MSLAWLVKNLLGVLLLPPGNGLLLLLIAGIFRKRRWAFGLAVAAGGLLLAQSLPAVSGRLIATLEQRAGPVLKDAQGAGAIVVLSSGIKVDAPEYGEDTARERTLVRIRYGAHLARRIHLPLLVSGGKSKGASRSEAEVMAGIIEHEFGVKVRWREMESHDTADNARMSTAILQAAGIRRVVLVTQAFHMPRARMLFEEAGCEVVPAPTDFKAGNGADEPFSIFDWLPQASALQTSYYALHEWLGILWLRLARLTAPA